MEIVNIRVREAVSSYSTVLARRGILLLLGAGIESGEFFIDNFLHVHGKHGVQLLKLLHRPLLAHEGGEIGDDIVGLVLLS